MNHGDREGRHAFIVRIWWEPGEKTWRGWVQHTFTGQARYLRSVDELLDFIQRFTGNLTSTEGPQEPWLP